MTLEEFHNSFLLNLRETMAERISEENVEYPSEELIFAELVMQHLETAGICDEATVCHWSGVVARSRARISGYSLSADETRLDLFINHYTGLSEVAKISKTDVQATATEAWRFLSLAAEGKLAKDIEPSHPVSVVLDLVRARWRDLDQVRLIVMTDGHSDTKHFQPRDTVGKLVSIEVVDIERLSRHSSGNALDEIAISFEQTIGVPLPCVHVHEPGSDYDYALAAIPGEVIRALYERYSSRLLEANVRTFLGSKRKVNSGIAATLKNEPGHFMAFNNGLVLVCESAEFSRCADGSTGISLLKGLQIVNGGQTSSSIYFTARENKGLDLSRVRVPAKIIIPKHDNQESRDRLVRDVSHYANSQTAVKTSDLSANRPFHVQLEKLANETWCPDGVTRWFYERANGAYQVMLLRDGTTDARRRRLREQVASSRRLTKNDVAMYFEAWRCKPAQVALAGEKNFAEFMKALDDDLSLVPQPLNAMWYRSLIAKVIVFKCIQAEIKKPRHKQTFRQGYVNVATYTVAVLSDRLGDRIDFELIWKYQKLSEPFESLLISWASVVNDVFNRVGTGRQFSELAKRPELWRNVQSAKFPDPSPRIPELRVVKEVS